MGSRFAVLLALALVARVAAAQPVIPSLPRLALDTYPPAARDAIDRAHQTATSRPDDAGAAGALGRVLQAWEQWDAAHQAYARAQALAPRAFEWHYLDAVVLARLARHTDAAAQLKTALDLSPAYLPARVKLAEALFESGDIDESGRLFEALVRKPACEPAARLGLGRVAAARGRHEEAVTHLQRAITLFPEFGAAYYALALSARALGRTEEARQAIAQHARYGPRWPAMDDPVLATVASVRDDARAYLQRGVKLADAGDVEGAIAAHEAALTRDGSLAQAHANLVSLYGRAGKWEPAEQHYRAAVAAGVNTADLHYDYGVLLGAQQKWEAAADAYRQAIALNPAHTHARNNLGQLLERDRKLEEATAEYRQAVQTEPTFRLARFNLGRMLIALGRPEEAVIELETLTQPRDAETPRYLFGLATALVRSGRKDDGIKRATEARDLAVRYGDTALAAAIDRDLARIR